MRVVLDANVFVSSLISPRGAPAEVVKRWLNDQFEVVVSPQIIEEVKRVLSYPKLQSYRQINQHADAFVQLVSQQATMIEPHKKISVIKDDPTDNRYLECARASRAHFLVSGDSHLLDLGQHYGMRIVPPHILVRIIEEQMEF